MEKLLRVWSYFSQPTDLAAELRDWPEFQQGSGYDVDLRDEGTGELVSVRYLEQGEQAHVFIASSFGGPLFDRVVGRVVHTMSGHTDHLVIDRHPLTEELSIWSLPIRSL